MKIKALDEIPFDQILECFNLAFSDYFVKFEANYDYLWNRFKAAGVDYSLSFGAFDGSKLVGFIISGIGERRGRKTVYNGGTGVIPEYRGNRIVELIYKKAIPIFKENGIYDSVLEVITENVKAIKAYKNVGFEIDLELACLNGIWNNQTSIADMGYSVELTKNWKWNNTNGLTSTIPTWENNEDALSSRMDSYFMYSCFYQGDKKGSIIMSKEHDYVAQLFLKDPTEFGVIDSLFDRISKKDTPIKLNNLNMIYESLLNHLDDRGIRLKLKQYEMVASF